MAFVAPAVFQAAGPTAASIQGTVDAFRAALGDPNNANNPGPLSSGRREINWDGGDPNIMDTTPPVTPFNVFLNTRGASSPHRGSAFRRPPHRAWLCSSIIRPTPPSSRPSARRGCSLRWEATLPTAVFFIPGTNGARPATVSGFGAVFTDVDQPDGRTETQGQHTDRVFRSRTASGFSAVLSRPRQAMQACPSLVSNSTTRASRRSRSRPMRPRAGMMIPGMTSS